MLFFTGVIVMQHPVTFPTMPATSPDVPMSTTGSSTTPAILGGIIVVSVIINLILAVMLIVLVVLQRYRKRGLCTSVY